MNGPYPSNTTPDSNHVFALLADYTDSLDSLPLDLTRNFSDLRELDAVLRSKYMRLRYSTLCPSLA
jgi:inhibitor of growth protein 3